MQVQCQQVQPLFLEKFQDAMEWKMEFVIAANVPFAFSNSFVTFKISCIQIFFQYIPFTEYHLLKKSIENNPAFYNTF